MAFSGDIIECGRAIYEGCALSVERESVRKNKHLREKRKRVVFLKPTKPSAVFPGPLSPAFPKPHARSSTNLGFHFILPRRG